jgi:hypothetical protein
MTTLALVNAFYVETKEVKNSVGGLLIFRKIMDYYLQIRWYQDEASSKMVYRKNHEIAQMIEQKFEKSEIDEVKSIYA